MEEEQERAEARREASRANAGAPFRFFVLPGESKQFIIVDDAPDFFRNEHALKTRGSNRYDTFVPCIDEHTNCPACAAQSDRSPYFAMYLTIIDLTPYTNRDGDEVPFSKKLLVVKPTQQKKIMRLYDRHKSLRGMLIESFRGSDKDAAIGNDMEFIEFVDEEDLKTYVYDYKDKEGKTHEVDCSEPYAYDEIMPDMTEQQLRALVGGRPDPSNRSQVDRDLQGDDWDNEPPARRPASRRAAAQDDQDEPPAPARRGRAAPVEEDEEEAAPAPRRRAAARDPEPESDEPPFDADEQEAEEAAPARRTAGRAAPERTAPARRPAAREQDDPPQRPARDASTVAQRRASLRRQG